jgi:hypothetical protein
MEKRDLPPLPHPATIHNTCRAFCRVRTARLQVAACGKSSLAALADWKPPAVTPLSEPKLRVARGGQGGGDEQSEAFTAAAVSSLFDR